MFGVVPKTIWNKLNPADDNNLCSWAMRCLLLADGDHLILIDNGIGDKQDEKFLGHYFLHGPDNLDKSLALHGFVRDDITDVFLTHLHFDHCGGSIKREGEKLIPAFKNATFWSNPQHWDWAVHPNDREKASFLTENILPIQQSGQLQLLEKGVEFSPAPNLMEIIYAFGHTEAMMLPKIRYKERTIVFMADLLPSAAHIPLPYVMAYDTRPLETLIEKKAFLEEALANNYILFFEHDPAHECCELIMTEKGIRPGQFFCLHEI